MSEQRYRFQCHYMGCGRVWYQDYDPAPRLGTLPSWQGPAGTTYGTWGSVGPCGHKWGAISRWFAEDYQHRMSEPEEEMFV